MAWIYERPLFLGFGASDARSSVFDESWVEWPRLLKLYPAGKMCRWFNLSGVFPLTLPDALANYHRSHNL
jgi:hypothetical protein